LTRQNPSVHIPDGFLDARTCAGTYCLAAAGLAWAGHHVRARWDDRTVPLLGVMSSFVFAGQLVNFPVAGGTSGHLLGGVLAAAMLGPAAATLALATVLAVQCLFFQDGGLTALGANVVNLALVGVWTGYGLYRLMQKLVPGHPGFLLGLAAGSWGSVVAASVGCALQLAAARTVGLGLVLPAMTLTHALIGIGEATITTAVVAFVIRIRPDLIHQPASCRQPALGRPAWLLWGLIAALGVVLLLAPLASTWPDGLEQFAERFGISARVRPTLPAPMPDYTVPGIAAAGVATALAGIAGVGLAFGLAWGLGRGLRRGAGRCAPPQSAVSDRAQGAPSDAA
jgi:cobalt/nickel transport system permease protein